MRPAHLFDTFLCWPQGCAVWLTGTWLLLLVSALKWTPLWSPCCRCEVKVIDLGSSCFVTDHLSSYVQSRSYRAPEVILGLPYDQKVDIWSFGCILAELLTGLVLFQVSQPWSMCLLCGSCIVPSGCILAVAAT